MGIFSYTLPPEISYLTILGAGTILFRNVRAARWKDLAAPGAMAPGVPTPGAFSAWCFSCIALPLLWSFDIPITSGLALHMLGMPLFVLMFGRQLAMTGIGLSVIAYTAMHGGLWANIGMNLLLLAVLPAYCGDFLMRGTRRFFPHHMFVYLLGNGFFGALLMVVAIGLASMATHLMLVAGALIKADMVAYMVLLGWGESFLTGLLLTIFTVYRPDWVLTFDDEIYLRGK